MKIFTYENAKITIFCTTLAALFFSAVLHKPAEFSETENRYLEQRPKLTRANLLDGRIMKPLLQISFLSVVFLWE